MIFLVFFMNLKITLFDPTSQTMNWPGATIVSHLCAGSPITVHTSSSCVYSCSAIFIFNQTREVGPFVDRLRWGEVAAAVKRLKQKTLSKIQVGEASSAWVTLFAVQSRGILLDPPNDTGSSESSRSGCFSGLGEDLGGSASSSCSGTSGGAEDTVDLGRIGRFLGWGEVSGGSSSIGSSVRWIRWGRVSGRGPVDWSSALLENSVSPRGFPCWVFGVIQRVRGSELLQSSYRWFSWRWYLVTHRVHPLNLKL